jgi:hypothetical protein
LHAAGAVGDPRDQLYTSKIEADKVGLEGRVVPILKPMT